MTPRQKIRLSGVISCSGLTVGTAVDGELLHLFATALVQQKTRIEVNGIHHNLRIIETELSCREKYARMAGDAFFLDPVPRIYGILWPPCVCERCQRLSGVDLPTN